MNQNYKSAMDKIIADDRLKEKTYLSVMTKRKKQRTSKPVLALAISICFLFFGIHLISESTIDQSQYSYITIDVNPSIEFILNKDDLIIQAIAYNTDGEKVLDDITYQNKDYQTVVGSLLKSSLYQSFLAKNNDIQVTVYSKNQDKCIELEENMDLIMADLALNHQYESICIDEKIHHEAASCHVSSGKYVIIQDIIQFDDSYAVNDLEEKTVTELKALYQTITNQAYDYDSIDHHASHSSNHH